MVSVGGSIGIGVFGSANSNNNTSGNGSGVPEVFVAAQDQQLFELSKPVKAVIVIHNQKTQMPITVQNPNGDFTHQEDSQEVTLNFASDAGDIIQIIPFF
ncbi:hypothetical protein [Algibacter sp. PT7-4]|uniref:hypothetical protein n=1 Tax=Algibacter ulvanivorans TaxID=3400999 RepID=UPI003AB09350